MNLEFILKYNDNEKEKIVCQNTNDLEMLVERLVREKGEFWITDCEVKNLEEIP